MARLVGISPNMNAFLDMIGWSEGTTTIPHSDDGYNVLVGATAKHPILFTSYADHPRIYNARFNSTGAGRYQIIKAMYDDYKVRCGLIDFSPGSQDTIAIKMITERGAVPDIENGNIYNAIALICPIWASLPGGNSGQHQNTMSSLLSYFQSATKYNA